ncbi:hypothetical protein LCGC14_2628220, partial [marine sediment metagenome]
MPHLERPLGPPVKGVLSEEIKAADPFLGRRPTSINVGGVFTVPVDREEDFEPTMKLIQDRLNEDPKLMGEIVKARQDKEAAAALG